MPGRRGRRAALAGGAHRGSARVPGRPALACAYYTYWNDVPHEEAFEAYYPPRRVILLFPTNDGQVCTFLEWPHAEFRSVRADVEGQVWTAMAQAPGLAERLGPAGVSAASSVRATCLTSSAPPTALAGRWSATPVITGIR